MVTHSDSTSPTGPTSSGGPAPQPAVAGDAAPLSDAGSVGDIRFDGDRVEAARVRLQALAANWGAVEASFIAFADYDPTGGRGDQTWSSFLDGGFYQSLLGTAAGLEAMRANAESTGDQVESTRDLFDGIEIQNTTAATGLATSFALPPERSDE